MILAHIALGTAALVAVYQLLKSSHILCRGNPYARPTEDDTND